MGLDPRPRGLTRSAGRSGSVWALSSRPRTHTLPDGRRLRADRTGEPTGWTVHVEDDPSRTASAPDIHDALLELLGIEKGQQTGWLIVEAAAGELAAHDTPLGRRYACPCCGHLTLERPPTNTFDICDVCFWEDDGVQFNDPDCAFGANAVSLREARATFAEHGVSERRFAGDVRPPLPGERP